VNLKSFEPFDFLNQVRCYVPRATVVIVASRNIDISDSIQGQDLMRSGYGSLNERNEKVTHTWPSVNGLKYSRQRTFVRA